MKGKSDKAKLKVDKEKCIGCATCSSIYPLYFEMDSEGKARPKEGVVAKPEEFEEMCQVCPVGAISFG